MPLYQNSIIYKLCHCNDLENKNIYVGSTTNFRLRKNQHKTTCNNEKNKDYNIFVYQFIRDNGGWNEWQMIPIEVYPCNEKKELEVKERHHIELLKPNLNKAIPTRSQKEWTNDNKEKVKKYKKKWDDNNKNKKKEWVEDNKEIIKEYKKKWSEEKVICGHCGTEVNKNNLKRHQQSKKCLGKQNIS